MCRHPGIFVTARIVLQRKLLTLVRAARRDVMLHSFMGWVMVPCVGSACRGLCDAGCGGEIALSKEERVKLERWVSTLPSVRHSEYTLTTCPKKWDHLNDTMCDRIESEWSVDGNIHDYRFVVPENTMAFLRLPTPPANEVRADANFCEPELVQIPTDAISEEFNGSGIGRDGPDLVYPLGPGSHTFTVLHSPANF